MNPAIFREYDIRGVAERDFDAAFARSLGAALAAYLADHAAPACAGGRRRVAVGRDCRLTSDEYAAAVRGGLREAGVDVVDLGMCPTPLCYFSLHELDLDGGVQVTASHNPPDQNGFKLCAGKTSMYGEAITEMRRRIEGGEAPRGTGAEETYDIVSRYRAYLAEHLAPLPRSVKVVVDAGNATAGPIAPPVLRALGCTVEELYCEPDGRFPNHHPDPTVEENVGDLVARVRASGAEVGIGFDGDADRIGVVDARGRLLYGDELLVLFAREVLREHPGARVIAEVKCSQRLFDDIAAHGGKGEMWRAGHSLIKARMRETGAALGGEVSGHIFFADRYFGFDDAIYAACRLVEILARDPRPLHDMLADLPPAYGTPEIRVACDDATKFATVERVRGHFHSRYPTIDIDGVRVTFPHGWGLLRASNTQAALVLRFEADSPEALREYRRLFDEALF